MGYDIPCTNLCQQPLSSYSSFLKVAPLSHAVAERFSLNGAPPLRRRWTRQKAYNVDRPLQGMMRHGPKRKKPSLSMHQLKDLIFDSARHHAPLRYGYHSIEPLIAGIACFIAWLRHEVRISVCGRPTLCQSPVHVLIHHDDTIILDIDACSVLRFQGDADIQVPHPFCI